MYHYGDVIMHTIASPITSLTIVYSTVYSDADQRKHQSSASLAFVRGIHRGPVNSPHKGPVTRKMFPFDDVIMLYYKKGRKSMLSRASTLKRSKGKSKSNSKKSPVWCGATGWTIAKVLVNQTIGNLFQRNFIWNQAFSFNKMFLKYNLLAPMWSAVGMNILLLKHSNSFSLPDQHWFR